LLKIKHILVDPVVKIFVLSCFIALVLPFRLSAEADTVRKVTSTRQEAIAFLETVRTIDASVHWPNVKPGLFLKNLKDIINEPINLYAGRGTNFCGYGALSYLFLKDDPLGYSKLMLELYREGKARFRSVQFDPTPEVKRGAGRIRYAGKLDVCPAEQLWYLVLADHFQRLHQYF
jgi:hypothetical protein